MFPHKSILIIEDNADGRESLRILLQLLGCHVEVASDGPEGIKKALAGRFDIALIDLALPGANGYVVARTLRNVLGPEIRLIAHTAYEEDRERALAAGFDMHLVKPADPRKIIAELVKKEGSR